MTVSNTASMQASFYKVRSNKVFEFFVVGVIIFSALVVGAKTYDIPSNILTLINILDWVITAIFLVEITIRFIAEENKADFFKSAWNIFDTLIVVVSLLPVEGGETALLGRLIRIFRVLRMVAIIPELRTLIDSLVKALPKLGYVVLLLFILFYLYAAIGSTFFAEINSELWGDIAISMLTLFRIMTFEDWTDVMYETMAVYPFSWIFYLTFIFLSAFAFLNMVIGIMVGVLEDEHHKQDAAKAKAAGEPNLRDIQEQLKELQVSISRLQGK